MQSRALIVILLATIYAIAGLSITADYRPDLNYGYLWTNSLFVTMRSHSKDMVTDRARFIKTYFSPLLNRNSIHLVESENITNSAIELRISVSNKKIISNPDWAFFGGKDKYLQAQKMVDCIFMYSVFEYFINEQLFIIQPDWARHKKLSRDQRRQAEELFMKYPEVTYIKKFFDDGCTAIFDYPAQ